MILITSNREKIREFERFLDVDFEVMNLEYPELKADEPCDVAMQAAKALAEKLQDEVIVEDSGLFIDALNGFPGTSTKFSHNRIGNDGLLKLMDGVRNRRCEYRSAIGFCRPGQEPKCFLGAEEGRIATQRRGTRGWGQDEIFIPKKARKTYGETRSDNDVNPFRHEAIRKLAAYLKSSA